MPLRIRISARREGRALTVVVANTGTLAAPGSTAAGLPCDGTGTGLSNVRERLKQLFPERHTFALTEQAGEVSARLTVTLAETA
jgi:LytS/YehU family sensor histidine kinase